MRISRDDPDAALWNVFLNGELQRRLMSADDAEGWVEYEDGRITLTEWEARRVYGKVEFRESRSALPEEQR